MTVIPLRPDQGRSDRPIRRTDQRMAMDLKVGETIVRHHTGEGPLDVSVYTVTKIDPIGEHTLCLRLDYNYRDDPSSQGFITEEVRSTQFVTVV